MERIYCKGCRRVREIVDGRVFTGAFGNQHAEGMLTDPLPNECMLNGKPRSECVIQPEKDKAKPEEGENK